MQETPYLKANDEVLGILRKVPFLRHHADKYLKNILELSKIRKYRPGEVIASEGEYDCWFYILLSGEVEVLKDNRPIARLEAFGVTIGELSVIDGEPRSATVRAESATTCLAIDGSFLDRMGPEDKQTFSAIYYRLLAEILAIRLRNTSEELSQLKAEMERLKTGPRVFSREGG